MREKFNLNDWVDTPKQQAIDTEPKLENTNKSSKAQPKQEAPQHSVELSEVETVVAKLEEAQQDITGTYSDWRNIGFAFADELGESGRDLFHRVSRFHAEYNQKECDEQFD